MYDVISSPNVSVDAARADLFDVNTDGLADLVVTDPARYRTASGEPAVGVFFNGFSGSDASPAGQAGHFSDAVAVPMPSALSGVLNLSNRNIVPMDVDGDGRNDWLHMPRLDSYGYFTATRAPDAEDAEVSPAAQGWRFSYAEVDLPLGTDPRVDFVRDGTHYRVLDVNGDHLIDIVRTTGTVMQTWLNLGWVPGGEGKFGQAWHDGGDWQLSHAPLESCLLQDGLPVDFADPELRLADMNGDGLQDLVRIRRGYVAYWPGRGPGLWGDGPSSCARGEGDGRERVMGTPPAELNPDLANVYLSDVNADGATDVIQARYRETDIWFSRAGESFTERITIASPVAPDFAPRIRFADIDGSATTDIVYGNAERWQYMDLMGGQRPRLLVGVHNGLGASTALEYGSSAEDYLADLQEAASCMTSDCERFTWSRVRATGCEAAFAEAGEPIGTVDPMSEPGASTARCYRSGGSPVLSTVVRAMETNDHFSAVGGGNADNVMRTAYAYHDGYYEGIEQEFRGFAVADAVAYGDGEGRNGLHPTQWSRTHFHQGRRPNEIATARLADNPYESLKGRQWLSETFDSFGEYVSTSHASVTARHLATGLDGRPIWYAFVSQSDELRYDYANYAPGSESLTLPIVTFEEVPASGGVAAPTGVSESHSVAVRAAGWAWIRGTTDEVDNLGHVRQQTAHGRLKDQHDAAVPATPYAEAIVQHGRPGLYNDSGQWIWRTLEGWVGGDGWPASNTSLQHSVATYDPSTGDLLGSTQVVELPLDEAEAPIAFEFAGDGAGAEGFTHGSQTLLASTAYDEWGNALASCAGADLAAGATGCLRYSEVSYDSAYAQLPELEATAVDASAGSYCSRTSPFCMVETSAAWDRGMGALLRMTGPNEQSTEVRYDGLGRLAAMQAPPADGCTLSGPGQRFNYTLNAGGLPVSEIVSRTLTGDSTCTSEAWLESRGYVDGLGRPRAGLTKAESTYGWVKGGVPAFSPRGSSTRSCDVETISSADPSPLDALAQPSTPCAYV
ncbi:MAG: hypothetical protein OEY14_12205, partial [Myxococcales bacterium]|nr:hypothetical protein [Myxococcales bacterium]